MVGGASDMFRHPLQPTDMAAHAVLHHCCLIGVALLACSLAGSEDELLNQLSRALAGVKTGVYALETVLQVTQSILSVLIIRTNTTAFDVVGGRCHVYSTEQLIPVSASYSFGPSLMPVYLFAARSICTSGESAVMPKLR